MKKEVFFDEKNISDFDLNRINNVSIFSSFNQNELILLLKSIDAKILYTEKDDVIFHEGDIFPFMCLLMAGEITLSKIDEYGNRNIIDIVKESHLFAEVFSFTSSKKSPVTATSNGKVSILIVDTDKLLSPSIDRPEVIQDKYILISKLLEIFADKNLILLSKIEVLSRRNTRDKILHFLELEKEKNHTNIFNIPFSRKDMADFLGVDRSALSRELSKLKDEKIIDFEKNTFKLLK